MSTKVSLHVMKEAACNFVYGGVTYSIKAKYYKRNGRSFIKAQWFVWGYGTSRGYTDTRTIYWVPLSNDEHGFHAKGYRDEDGFIQHLGEFLYKELHLEGVHY